MIRWLRSFLDNGESSEREQIKQQVDQVMTEAETELKTSQEARLERLAERYDQIKLRPLRPKRTKR